MLGEIECGLAKPLLRRRDVEIDYSPQMEATERGVGVMV